MSTDVKTGTGCVPPPACPADVAGTRTRYEPEEGGSEAWDGIWTEALMEAAPHDMA